jgi:hypothetical protein
MKPLQLAGSALLAKAEAFFALCLATLKARSDRRTEKLQ